MQSQENKIIQWIIMHYKIVIIIFILILSIMPLIINALYNWETNCKILHSPSPWTTFWATYLAAIASFGMVFITWWTMKQSKKTK